MRLTQVLVTILWLILISASHAQTEKAVMPPQLLVHNTTIILKVPHYAAARNQIVEAVQAQGGELMDASELVDIKGRYHGWVRFQVPQASMIALSPALNGIGKLYAEKVVTTDNLSDYETLARRVDSLKLHEDRLDSVLKSPRRMRGSDILYLQERLFRANVDQGLLLQKRFDYARASQVSSLQVELFEPGTMPSDQAPHPVNLNQWFQTSSTYAHLILNRQMARGATASAYVLAYAPLWLPLLAIAIVLIFWLWRMVRRFMPTIRVWRRKAMRRLVRMIANSQIPGFR